MSLNLLQRIRFSYSFFVLIFSLIPQYTYAVDISNLITPVDYYTNHDNELEKLKEQLNIDKKISLVGVSGIGKTQLARKYANLNKMKYKIIWFFDGSIDLKQQFVELAKEINKKLESHSNVKVAEGINEAKDSVIGYLKLQNNFLIVVDNLKVKDNKNAKLFLDWESNGHIIFCSQDAIMLPNIISIPYLTIEASKQLIKEIIPNLNNDFVIRLAKELKGYPITTAKSAVFLGFNNYITFEEYEKYLQKFSDNMESYVKVLSSQLNESTIELLNQLVFLNNQNMSKSLIKKIASSNTFIEDLISLNRYQIISAKTQNENFPVFEMHDKLRESILAQMGENKIKKILPVFVDKINGIIPIGKNTKQELVLSDHTLISNLEELLIKCKKYQIDEIKILELKKNLMSFDLGMGVVRCQDFKDWFINKKQDFLSSRASEKSKALAAEFLILIGVYDYFINADHISAMKFLHEAENIISDLSKYNDLKYMVYSQLAQAYVYNAEMEKTLEYIKKAKSIDTKTLGISLDATLLLYIEAKYYLSQGEYKKALNFIEDFIEIIKDHPIDYYFAPIYVMKATILNYIGDYNAAYNIVKPIYDKEINEISKGNAGGIRLRVIIELARSELGKRKVNDALRHAEQAIDIYKKDNSRQNFDLKNATDTDLADAFIIYADTLCKLNKEKDAIHYYSIAEAIYYNKYHDNIKNLDEISLLYYKAIKASSNIKDDYSQKKFTKRLVDKFGDDNSRVQLLVKEQ